MHQSNNRDLLKAAAYCAAVVVVCGVLFAVSGCQPKRTSLDTGTHVSASSLPLAGWAGDATYAVVDSSALPQMFEDLQNAVFKQGLAGQWDSRFDCNRFASLYIGLAHAKYAVKAWHHPTGPQALALAEIWYRPDNAPQFIGHAIVAALTERGLIFIEPQHGREISLTPQERAHIYFVKW